jgi:hypothetical protein
MTGDSNTHYDVPGSGTNPGGSVDRTYLLLVAAALFGAFALVRIPGMHAGSSSFHWAPPVVLLLGLFWSCAIFALVAYFRTRLLLLAAVFSVITFLIGSLFTIATWWPARFGLFGDSYFILVPLGMLGFLEAALLGLGLFLARHQTGVPGLMVLAGLSFPVCYLFTMIVPSAMNLVDVFPPEQTQRILTIALCVRDAFNALFFWIIYNRAHNVSVV